MSFVGIDNQFPVFVVIPDGDMTTAMEKSGFCSCHASHFGAFFYLFALQLGEYSKKSYHGFPKRRRRVKAFLHRDEVYIVRKKDFLDKVKCVPLGAGETVKLVNQHQIKFVCFLDKMLHTGAIKIASCVSPVNIDVGYYPVLSFAVCNQTFFLFADRITLLRLLLSGDADYRGRHVSTRHPI